MKLTDMIDALNSVLAEHGDIEVLSDSADGCLPVEIGAVQEVVSDEDGTRSKALMMWGLETICDDGSEESDERDDIETGAGGA